MKYVLDSSVAFKWEVAEVDSDKAIRLRDEVRLGLHELIATDILPVEVAHSMTRAERQGRVSRTDGWRLWAEKRAGQITDEEFCEAESCMSRSAGHCMAMAP